MNKRIITVFLTLILICSLTVMSKVSLASFTDVPDHEWFAESVEYVKDKGLMNGITVTTFEPQTSITRGMIVTIIYRLEGSPEVKSELQFSDVNPTYYYCTPIIWASENGIVNGYSKDTFAPDDEITREQFATILYRYAEKKGLDVSLGSDSVDLSSFEDESKISEYAVKALSWANEAGLIKGVTVTTLEPQGKATRAQAATIFMRFDKLIEQSEQSNSSIESKDDETDNDETAPGKNGDSSSSNDSGSPKDPVKNDDKDDGNNDKDNNNDDDNAGEWDDVKDENSKNENTGNDSSKDEPSNDDPIEEDDNEDEAYENPTIVVDNASVRAGEEVSISVELHNNPGILGMTLKLKFDEEVMTLTEVKKGTALSETTFTAPKGEALKNGCRFLWDAEYVSIEDVTNGNILKLTFEIVDDAETGDYNVTLSYNNGAVIDNDMLPVNLEIINGKISIKQGGY